MKILLEFSQAKVVDDKGEVASLFRKPYPAMDQWQFMCMSSLTTEGVAAVAQMFQQLNELGIVATDKSSITSSMVSS